MISIITPTYNRKDLVQITIKSIMAQTYTNWELIIVDDGSTDNTAQAIQQFLTDKRIQFIKKENTGTAHSLNIGATYAIGDFITFLDSDDEAYPNWLETVVQHLKEDTGIACVGAIRKLIDGTKIKEDLSEYFFYGKIMRLKFTAGSLFIKRNIFNEIGGYDFEMQSNIHTDLGYRLIAFLIKTEYKIITIDQNLVQINIHAGPRVRTNWVKRKVGGIQFLNKHYNFIYKNNKKEIANLCSTIAYSNYKLKRRKESVRYLLKAIKFNPYRGKNYIRIFKYSFF